MDDSGTFVCKATNKFGSVQSTMHVNVQNVALKGELYFTQDRNRVPLTKVMTDVIKREKL